MPAFVIDASVASSGCFPDERSGYTNAVMRTVSLSLEAIAPSLWAYEVRNSVLMGLRRGRITRERAQEFLSSLTDLCVRLIDPPSYDDLFRLVDRTGLTVYDAAYLDLSMRAGAQLASVDGALCKAAAKSGVLLFEAKE